MASPATCRPLHPICKTPVYVRAMEETSRRTNGRSYHREKDQDGKEVCNHDCTPRRLRPVVVSKIAQHFSELLTAWRAPTCSARSSSASDQSFMCCRLSPYLLTTTLRAGEGLQLGVGLEGASSTAIAIHQRIAHHDGLCLCALIASTFSRFDDRALSVCQRIVYRRGGLVARRCVAHGDQ